MKTFKIYYRNHIVIEKQAKSMMLVLRELCSDTSYNGEHLTPSNIVKVEEVSNS